MRPVDPPRDITRTPADPSTDARRPAVGDRPGTARPSNDLRHRLDHLSPGHPSFPHEADQKARSPIRDLRETYSPIDHDSRRRPETLCSFTDAEWVEHKAEVRDELENAKASDLTTD